MAQKEVNISVDVSARSSISSVDYVLVPDDENTYYVGAKSVNIDIDLSEKTSEVSVDAL